MPLIKCPEPACGQMVSDRADACPKCGAPISSSKEKHDPRVTRALQKVGYKNYEIMEDGDIKITLKIDDSRSQCGIICSDTNTTGGIEYRSMYSVANKVPAPINAQLANLLLFENRKLILGNWGVSGPLSDGKVAIVLTLQVPAECEAETLEGSLGALMRKSDKFEQDHFGTDDY